MVNATSALRRLNARIALLLVLTFVPGVHAAAQWEASGLEDLFVLEITQTADGVIFASTNHGLYQSTDDGLVWSATEFNMPYSSIVIGPTGVMLLSTGSEIALSEDNGASWTPLTLPAPADRIWHRHIGPDGTFILTTTGDVFYSWDHGASWGRGNTGLPAIPDVSTIINTADYRIVCGTGGITGGGVYASSDGSSWTSLLWAGENFDIQALGASANLMLAGIYNKGIWRSLDGGETWEQSTGFTASASGFLIDENIAYMSSATSVFRSDDQGATWAQMGDSFDGFVHAMFTTNAGTLLVGTDDGIFRSSASTDVADDRTVAAPGIQVHPNPAARQTVLNIDNPAGAPLEIDLLTQSGALVRRLPTDMPGTSLSLSVDVSDLAAGVYFVRVRSDVHTVMQKLVVLP